MQTLGIIALMLGTVILSGTLTVLALSWIFPPPERSIWDRIPPDEY